MRILYVSGGFPYPLTSGRLRHYHLIRQLSRRHHVSLLSLAGPQTTDDDVAALEPYASVHVVRAEPSALRRLLTPLGVAVGPARLLGRRAQELASSRTFDVVVLAGSEAFPVFPLLARRLPVVSDLCDLRSLNHLRRLRVARIRDRPLVAAQYLLARLRERSLLKRSDCVLFASASDRRAAASAVGAQDGRVALVPNGVDVDYWRRTSDRLGHEVVFTGAMDYAPNTDAALQLIDVVMPLVRRDLSDARLRIVGRDPPAALRQRAAAGTVTVTGLVEDVRPHLEEAAVFAAPLRFGAGIQNKVLEAMAMAVPCVISPLAAAGLATDESVPPVSIARDPAEFAQQISLRLRAATGGAPDAAARAYVTSRFSWETAAERLEARLKELANVPRS